MFAKAREQGDCQGSHDAYCLNVFSSTVKNTHHKAAISAVERIVRFVSRLHPRQRPGQIGGSQFLDQTIPEKYFVKAMSPPIRFRERRENLVRGQVLRPTRGKASSAQFIILVGHSLPQG